MANEKRRTRYTPAKRPEPRAPKEAPAPVERRERFLAPDVRIVHDDNDIIVIDKPSGLLTVAAVDENRDNVFAMVKRHVREQVKRRGTKVWVVHRLDKEASGLIVFAKTEEAFTWLKEDLRAKRVRRIYFAVVEGEISGKRIGDVGVVQSFLEEDDDGIMRAVPAASVARSRRDHDDEAGKEARPSVTHYRVRAISDGRTLLELKLETGRKNQIRAHMTQLGHPIVGDRRYGAKSDPIDRVCLHAAELGFSHAGSGKMLQFTSDIPPSFLKLVGEKELREPPPPSAQPEPVAPPDPSPAKKESWDHVADWYEHLLDQRGSDHHDDLLLPGALRLLHVERATRVLDVACGQGVLCRRLAEVGAKVVGVDASPRLIAAAKKGALPGCEYQVGDARDLGALRLGEFDRVSCVMALMNIEPLSPVLRGVAQSLKQGGEFVAVMLHPAFRSPGQTSWGWAPLDGPKAAEAGGPRGRAGADNRGQPPASRQFRRVDGYLSAGQSSIVMNPGRAAKGEGPVLTWTYHRPVQTYVRALAEAGLLVNALEEWPSLRTSEPGPHASEENRARREIPMFLAIRAIKIGTAPGPRL